MLSARYVALPRSRVLSLSGLASGLLLISCERTELLAVIATDIPPSVPADSPSAGSGGTGGVIDAGPSGGNAGAGGQSARDGAGGQSGRDAGPLLDASLPLRDAGPDSSMADSGLADAGTDADPGSFGPTRVIAVSDPVARDTDPTFTADLLELYFVSDRAGARDIYLSMRGDPSEAWGPPTPVAELNTGPQDENPHVSGDGLRMWFFTDRDRSLGSIWHSTRASRGDRWSDPVPVPELNVADGASDVSVAITEDETLAILNSKFPGAQPYNLYEFTRMAPTEPFEAFTLLEEVSSLNDDFDPDVRQGGLFLAYESELDGLRQIFWTRRPSLTEPFSPPLPVPQLRSEFDDAAPVFSEDTQYVMYSSSREGSEDLYEAWLGTPD